MTTQPMDLALFVPNGILPTDVWHWDDSRHPGTCSRCRKPLSKHDMPLAIYGGIAHRQVLSFCTTCTGGIIDLTGSGALAPAHCEHPHGVTAPPSDGGGHLTAAE